MNGFQKAKKEKLWLKILMGGASGSGKTYSALSVATGIAKKSKGKIAMINTEGSRGKYYAKEFNYDILDLDVFTPESYIKAINMAIDAGYDVLIIDSTTHEWKCINEIHDNMPGNSFQNWSKLKPRQFAFSEAINKSPIHIIATGRGKDEYVMEEKNGKQNPKKVGVGIQQEKDVEYEYTVSFNIAQDTHVADVMKDNTHLFEGKYEVLTEKHGELLYDWANDGENIAPVKEQIKEYEKTVEAIEKPLNVKDLQVEIVNKATELGGSKNKKVVDICMKEIGSKNPYSCEDLDKLNKLMIELNKIEKEEK